MRALLLNKMRTQIKHFRQEISLYLDYVSHLIFLENFLISQTSSKNKVRYFILTYEIKISKLASNGKKYFKRETKSMKTKGYLYGAMGVEWAARKPSICKLSDHDKLHNANWKYHHPNPSSNDKKNKHNFSFGMK